MYTRMPERLVDIITDADRALNAHQVLAAGETVKYRGSLSDTYTISITRTINVEAPPNTYIDHTYVTDSLTTTDDGLPGLDDDWTDTRTPTKHTR